MELERVREEELDEEEDLLALEEDPVFELDFTLFDDVLREDSLFVTLLFPPEINSYMLPKLDFDFFAFSSFLLLTAEDDG